MVQIITDSMSDIRQGDAQNRGLTVLPQHVLFGDESFLDGVTLSIGEFYEKLAEAKELPKTSQVTPEAFASAFDAALSRGDEVICVLGSSGLSGTYQSATIAKDMQKQDAPIYLIDTQNASLAEQALVWEAVRLRDLGEPAEAIVQKISALKERVSLVGQVQNLKHLVMGGRLSSATAHIGTTLRLKPMLRMAGGRIVQDGMTRGKKRAYEWMKRQLEEQPRDHSFPLYLASANAPEEFAAFRAYLEAEGVAEGDVRAVDIGPIVGTHTGQGLLALAWIRKTS